MYNSRMRMALLLQLLLFCNILYGQQLCIFDGDEEIKGSYNADDTNGEIYEITDGRHTKLYSADTNNDRLVVSVSDDGPSYICDGEYDVQSIPDQDKQCQSWLTKTTSSTLQCGEFYSNDVSEDISLKVNISSLDVVISTDVSDVATIGSATLTSPDDTAVQLPLESGAITDTGLYTLDITVEDAGRLQIEISCSASAAIQIEPELCELCVSDIAEDIHGVNGDYDHTVDQDSYKKINNGCNKEEIDIFPTISDLTLRKWLIGTTNVIAYYICNDDDVATPHSCQDWREVHSLECGGKVAGDLLAFQISIFTGDETSTVTITSSGKGITSLRAFDSTGQVLTIDDANANIFVLEDQESANYIFYIDKHDTTDSTSFVIAITCSHKEITPPPDPVPISSETYNIAIKSGDCVSNDIEINECEEDTLHPVLIIIIVAINVIVIIIAIIIIITVCLRRKKAATAIKEKDDEQESMLTEEQVKKRLDLLDLDKFEDQHAERLEAKRLKSVAILGSNIDVDIDVNDSDAPKM